MTYCEFVNNPSMEEDNPNKDYHNNHYGFPVSDDNELFERLVLEINQAGLSWITILKKQSNFRKAYNSFDIKTVANYTDKDIERLLNDSGIAADDASVREAMSGNICRCGAYKNILAAVQSARVKIVGGV